MKVWKSLLIVIYLLLNTALFSQPSLPKEVGDSLWKTWENRALHDTVRLKAMEKICWEGYLFKLPDSAYHYAQILYNYAEKRGLIKYMSNALSTQGVSHAIRGNYDKAVDHFSRSLKLAEKNKDFKGVGNCYNNLGMIYKEQGNYSKSIEYFTQSLKIRDKEGDNMGIASSMNNIGLIYEEQNDLEKALEYYLKSINIFEKINDQRGISVSSNNIGMIYKKKGDYEKALSFYERGLKIKEKMGNKQGEANSLNNIGAIYFVKKDFDKALECFNKSLKINQDIGDQQGLSSSYINLANVFIEKKNFLQSKIYGHKGLKLAQDLGTMVQIKDAAQSLWETYKESGNYKESLSMFELYINTRDTLLSEESQREVLRQGFKYDYDKKATADSIKTAEEKKIKDAQIAQQNAEIKVKKNQQFMLFGGLILVLIFAVFMYNRFKITQKQKQIIEIQKVEVEKQRDEINEKNELITESIEYAKTIQEAIVTSDENLKKLFKDIFVLFKPKDIVSGDFYWAYKSKSNKIFWAAADCTGHGVPGAFMTMIGSSLLNEIIIEKGIEETNLILDQLRDLVIKTLNKNLNLDSDEKMRNGMDIALCCLDLNNNNLSFSGANNPMIVIREGEILEFKADKQPIGIHKKMNPFTLQNLEIKKGDRIYTFSDGYADQMNDQGMRYKIANLRKTIMEASSINMSEQKEYFNNKYENWRGNYEQIDDVVMIGVEI